MNRLSSPIETIKQHYDVVVVGSGYGGGIAASRLARAGKRVCVLERGKERLPGEYPDTTFEGAGETQWDLPHGHKGSSTAMFDFRVNPDVSVLVGCGLGGTSLINAGVSFRPDERLFDDPVWPEALRREKGARLAQGFALAEQMLGANPYPVNEAHPPKLVAHKRSADGMRRNFYTLPINVTFTAGHNFAGVAQRACSLCGDCVTGCNNGSKNTVLMNYLPDARRHGAEIFVEAGVRWIEPRQGGGWLVQYQPLDIGRDTFGGPPLSVAATTVVLAAGALGSTEILLRSHAMGKLAVSSRLGQGFSGNGDVLGFGYNTSSEIRGVGLGQNCPQGDVRLDEGHRIGPTIAGVIDMRDVPNWRDGMVIEEGVAPGLLGPILAGVHKLSAALGGVNTAQGRAAEQSSFEKEAFIHGPYTGATLRTQTYLGMCHDGSNGVMQLADDRLRIAWPGIGDRPVIKTLNDRLFAAAAALEGVSVPDPIWSTELGKNLITVHPLGGCNMGDSAERGVVDHTGKVFSSSTGDKVHAGLYVCDGSILPTSLGVNPLLTISALAERMCMIMADEGKFAIDYAAKGPIVEPDVPSTVGIRFSESMQGWFSPGPDADYEAAARRGEDIGSTLRIVVTIAADDVDAMIAGAGHEARMVGTVMAPALSPDPLEATQGVFNLFVPDPVTPGVRHMDYRMLLMAKDGRTLFFRGFKTIREGRPFWDAWHDSTTLYVTLHEGVSEADPVVGTGIISIPPGDVVRLLSTIDATGARDVDERLAATAKFGRFFAGILYDYYGGISAKSVFEGILSFEAGGEPEAPPRKRRPLRVGPPEPLPVPTAGGGGPILLTRYHGGPKGPVILAHGIGTSSRMFSTDTTGTNLLEFLFAEGYDVWLMESRASMMLPAAPRGSGPTLDDLAQKDWPAAVGAVLDATRPGSVQVVAHDLGAITLSMALLGGLQGVRSAVLSQVATHLVTPHTPMGKVPACGSDVCTHFMEVYRPLYEHAHLHHATHDAVFELFGDADPALLDALAAMARKGHVVDAAGNDTYLAHLERMAIPIRFVHGEKNLVYLPESTAQALAALAQKNGPKLYSRVEIPGHGHYDCMFGKHAARDVFPLILDHLEET